VAVLHARHVLRGVFAWLDRWVDLGRMEKQMTHKMRFLSVAACALAASLFSAGPSQAIVVETDMLAGVYQQFTVYGPIPDPIEIMIGWSYDVTELPKYPREYNDGYGAGVMIGTLHSQAYPWYAHTITGAHTPDWLDNTFTLLDTDRTIYISFIAQSSDVSIVNNVWVNFSLPDNLSIAAPVPEPSSWALLIIGFAGIALVRRYRPTRAAIVPLQSTEACWEA
jgi:hypothetical protein